MRPFGHACLALNVSLYREIKYDKYPIEEYTMVTTTDPFNFVLESLRRQLEIEVSDPRSNRRSNSQFVQIGPNLRNPQYPFLLVTGLTPDSGDAALGQSINASDSASELVFPIQIQVFASNKKLMNLSGNRSGAELIRNLGSQVTTALIKVSNKKVMDGSYDIKQVSVLGGNSILGPDPRSGEMQLPVIADVEFLYRY